MLNFAILNKIHAGSRNGRLTEITDVRANTDVKLKKNCLTRAKYLGVVSTRKKGSPKERGPRTSSSGI